MTRKLLNGGACARHLVIVGMVMFMFFLTA